MSLKFDVVRGKNEGKPCTSRLNSIKKESEKNSLELRDVKVKYMDREQVKDFISGRNTELNVFDTRL